MCSSRKYINVESVPDTVTKQNSVVVTIQGSGEENNIVILGAHLDSISDADPKKANSTLSPGADDNASGIMVLVEVIRVIIVTGYRPKKTVQIMAYGAEEIE